MRIGPQDAQDPARWLALVRARCLARVRAAYALPSLALVELQEVWQLARERHREQDRDRIEAFHDITLIPKPIH